MPEPDPAAIRAAVLEVVENQLRDGTPPEAKQAFERLTTLGYTPQESRRLIGVLVAREIFEALKYKTPYDGARYAAALQQLPELPEDLRE